MKVNGKEVAFTFDTGAEVSTITEKVVEKLGLKLRKPDRVLAGADGNQLNVVGVAEVCLENRHKFLWKPKFMF